MNKGIEQELFDDMLEAHRYQQILLKDMEKGRQSNITATEKAKHRLKDLPNSNQPEPEALSWARLFFQW